MDDDTKQQLILIRVELQALRLVTNEALSVALSHETNPDTAASLARQDLEKILDGTLEQARLKTDSQFQIWVCNAVRRSVIEQLDSIEKRVSTLTHGRITH